ncbi:MAG: glycoside hydrolase family 65 protein, partial [Candidatus Sumerlaeota bacterium]
LSGADFQHEANCVPENSSDTFCFTLKSGEKAALEKHASFYTNIETEGSKLASSAKSEVLESADDGFQTLKTEQADFWADHWKYGDVQIEGNASDQQAMRLSLFHLRQGTPTDGYRSVGANSLTGDKYCGHVFWDTEMYVEPCLAYLDPSLVKPLLMYRYNILDKARERAIQMEGKGALYSWNSISGEECGVVFEAATAEYHLESAIAWAVKRYVDQSGDQDFLYEYGAEMLFETARFLEDRGAYVPWKKQQFCLNAVCGPDEYGCAVNNNCYTNMMTQWHLEYAANIHAEMEEKSPELLAELKKKIGLEQSEVEAWREAARRMYVPYNEALGIHEQDDSFLSLDPVDMSKVPLNKDIREEHHPLNLWRMQVAKQADVVLLMFVRGELFDLETKRRNYDFYEARTCHGSSLSACIHSIVAAEVGLADHAYAYFHQSARMDMCDFKDNTSAGVHTACLGGTWMALVQGFAGMRDYSDGLHLAPRLPNEWKGYAFHLMYRANRIKISVDKDGCTCRLVDGEGLDIHTDASVNRLDRDNSEIKCDLLPWTDT